MLVRRRGYSIAVFAIVAMSAEAVIVELFYVIFAIPTLTVAAIAIPIAGLALLLAKRRGVVTLFKEQYKSILLISLLFAITEFLWYDALSKVGASKLSLIELSETIMIVALAWIFLNERLTSKKIAGGSIVLIGIMISISLNTTTSSVLGGAESFGIGEVEAILAAASSAIYIILVTRLLSGRHAATDVLGAAAATKTAAESPASAAASAAAVAVAEAAAADEIHVTGFSLLVSGLMLQVQWLFVAHVQTTSIEWTWLLVLTPILPLTVFLFQFMSYARIGASLTSIIVSMHVFLVIIIQVILYYYSDIPVAVPENLVLACIGGVVSVGGIVILERD